MKQLTKAEEEIMQIIWELGPSTVGQIRDYIEVQMKQVRPPHSTISTMVRILEEKGFLDHKAYGRTHEYFPLVSKEHYSKQTIHKFVEDYFEGSANRLVSFLVKEKDLNLKDLTELLNKLEEE
ncbi:MAG: BlaI/MecI/CopY family transcriptional regulator [Lewinellaceae bacterium]|nr:BlaI/MecI/CopY family transcriptional regulator [Lewinellaceae bacterium]